MDYTSIHVYGHLLSDDILHAIEQDYNLRGNRAEDFAIDTQVGAAIDYVWSSLRNDWRFYNERSMLNDPYGTRRSRDLMERLFGNLGYTLQRQTAYIGTDDDRSKRYDITYLCPDLHGLPIIVIGDRTGDAEADALDKCSLDYRSKGAQRRKSPHATMLEYLNNTECVYGIVANGQTLRLIRNTGQLVKLVYLEFDLRRMLEEDKYTEFCLLFRLMHASRFRTVADEACVMDQYFNLSIESGNRIRDGLSAAVQRTMERIGQAAVQGTGEGNDRLREALTDGTLTDVGFNKELIHFIYRLLFLFIIEDRNLVYQLPSADAPDYARISRQNDIYKRYYAASRLRHLSELNYLRNHHYADLWQGLMDTFHLFESGDFGSRLGIKPLGGVLFDGETLRYLRHCTIGNDSLLEAFAALNEFTDERGNRVKINYSSLDVEEFGSVYEGILEMRPYITPSPDAAHWDFGFVGGLDRQSTSSYYTRPDLVQNLIRTTLEPVIKERVNRATTSNEQVSSLLSLKVCDAACGSGHIVLAMARTIAWYVCSIRTGEDNPASPDYREALREVIQMCVYAVDSNPDAVELCKVVLWIEGYCAGKPLSFLDHHIRCGNSVLGVTMLDDLLHGVPQEAFAATDKDTLRRIRKINAEALKDIKLLHDGKEAGVQVTLFNGDYTIQHIDSEQVNLATQVREIAQLPENSLLEELTKQHKWEDLMQSPRVECLRRACDLYAYAFYKQFTPDEVEETVREEDGDKFTLLPIPYTRTIYQALEEIKYLENPSDDFMSLTDDFKEEIVRAARQHRFFHWCVEFPEIFANNGGFDVMCGNPPWDKIKIEDKKWFESQGRTDIVNAGTASQRKQVIANLPTTDPVLHKAYQTALHDAEALSRFIRFAGRFPLTATGDIDLYPLFAELCLSFSKEAWGLVLPTGIAVNDSNKDFFAKLVNENRLVSLFDFENREALFDIHRMFKFCLLTAGKAQSAPRTVSGGFFLTRLDHLLDPNRIYTLQTDDIALFSPNTKTCPIFRTSRDAKLTKKIYRNAEVLMNEAEESNPWEVKFARMIDMSNDSHLFRTYEQLTSTGATLSGNHFSLGDATYVPLYEGKMIWHYNHHYGTWPTRGERPNSISSPSLKELQDANHCIMPWYWIPLDEAQKRLIKKDSKGKVLWQWEHRWLIGFRDITNATNERTFITTLLPNEIGANNKVPLIFPLQNARSCCCLLAMMTSLPFDYVAKQKVGGSSMNFFIVKQLPVLSPEQLIASSFYMEIVKRVAELCYFNHDLDGWATELWEEMDEVQRTQLPQLGSLTPFVYDEARRAQLQAELDAIFAHLYGLNTEDILYILDPEEVCGTGCINETFRVLKDNEKRNLGEYRTKRLVMEAWHRFGFDGRK
ncbi:MAG: restriction endonuclease [Mediterranea sp.]|jgi:hypothetical protein|nr:restriction endonuclease [Mediterranea sp.]